MKAVLALFLSLCILFSFSPACVAESENYDTVTLSAVSGQAVPVSYTVDAYGDGQDDTSGDAVSLMR